MNFPNLNDTNFPNFENINVWQYKNNFDYSRWETNVTIRVVNVPWDSSYTDVVKFSSDDNRDNYFDDLDGNSFSFSTMFRINNVGKIKLPIPYEVIAQYNYLYVINPIATSETNPIMYENMNKNRLDRCYYFIIDSIQLAPNTTELTLQPDIWTTYINTCDINYLFLARGHYGVANSDTDKFLSNPIDNSDYLLAQDISENETDIVAYEKFWPICGGTPRFCVVSTIAPSQISNVPKFTNTSFSGSDWTSPTYYDRDVRWGDAQGVNGYSFGTTPTNTSGYFGDRVDILHEQPCLTMYAFDFESNSADSVKNTLTHIAREYPSFYASIRCACILGADVIENESVRQFSDGTIIYQVKGKNSDMANISLTKNMFDIDNEYQRFAKLYTSQYSTIEISDNDEQTIQIKPENTQGFIGAHIYANIAYPTMNIAALFRGVNTNKSAQYSWTTIIEGQQIYNMPYESLTKTMLKFGIATFAMVQSGLNDWLLQNTFANLANRERAVANYMHTVGNANNNKLNTSATGSTNVANTQRTGSTNVANTQRTGSTNIANTQRTGSTNVANTHNITTVNNENAELAKTTSNTMTLASTSAAQNATNANTTKIVSDASTDIVQSVTVQAEENNMVSLTATANSASGFASGVGSAISGFGTATGFFPATIGGMIVSGVADAIGAHATSEISVGTASAITQAGISATLAKAQHAVTNANSNVVSQNTATLNNDTTSHNANVAQVAASGEVNNTNAGNTAATNNANASAIAATNNTNTSATASTDNSNAGATASTDNSNATYVRNENVEYAKNVLESERDTLFYARRNASMQSPILVGDTSGIDNGPATNTLHYMRMEGFSIRIKTVPKYAQKQIGDYFARFGYAIDSIVDASELQIMNYFSYWRASEIWINANHNKTVEQIITLIFKQGTTVWDNPENIGKVSVYGN